MPAGSMSHRVIARAASVTLIAAFALAGVASASTGGAVYGEKPPKARAASAQLQKIAECESGGDPTAVSKNGKYRGKYQFDRATWRDVGGTGDPAEATEAEQDKRAAILLKRGGPAAWPNCA